MPLCVVKDGAARASGGADDAASRCGGGDAAAGVGVAWWRSRSSVGEQSNGERERSVPRKGVGASGPVGCSGRWVTVATGK